MQSFLRNGVVQAHKIPCIRRRFITSLVENRSARICSSYAAQGQLIAVGSVTAVYSEPLRFSSTNAEANVPIPVQIVTPRCGSTSRWTQLKNKAKRALLMFARMVKLSVALAPIALLFALQAMRPKPVDNDAHSFVLVTQDEPSGLSLWYLNMCLLSVEWSGAAVIKLMQWAGSRPDLFGHEFCSIFSRLQDNTLPHAWKHTEKKMEEAFGEDWASRIQLQELLGSGCIGQVYKGVVLKTNEEVAVKVMHPNVRDDIDTDLDLMRLAAYFFSKLGKAKYLNLQCVVDEFAEMLKLQLDLRREAKNLDRFNNNFKDDPYVVFPKLNHDFVTTRDVLVESFCAGVPVLKYAREHQHDQETLSQLCLVGIRVVCKMLFNDNFMHGDLHPGNVLVDPYKKKFILLDVGMVKEYNDAEHQLIVNVLTSFIRKDGRRAGRFMLDDSNRKQRGQDAAMDEELYIDKIEALTIKASDKDYFMEHLGTYISYICEAASTHHVMMNQSFVSAALAIKVQEGLALALDPGAEIWRVANPIILRSETRRRWRKLVGSWKETVFGEDSNLAKQMGPRQD